MSRQKEIIEEYFDTASWDDDWSPHYNIAPTQEVPATRDLRLDFPEVARVSPKVWLGHESLATTQKYWEPSKETEEQLDRVKLPF